MHPAQPRHHAQPAQATDSAVITQPATAALSTVPALPAVATEPIVIALPADPTLHAVAAQPAVRTLPLVPTAKPVTRLSLVDTDAPVTRLERVSALNMGSRRFSDDHERSIAPSSPIPAIATTRAPPAAVTTGVVVCHLDHPWA